MDLRLGTERDAAAVAQVHVDCWHETYRGLVPDILLETLDVSEKTQLWQAIFQSFAPEGPAGCYVAERDGVVVGFCSVRRQSQPDHSEAGYEGEVSAIYLRRHWQGQGIGAAMLRAGLTRLARDGLSGASLTVLAQNSRARAFYTAMGGQVFPVASERRQGHTLEVVGYGWRGLATD